MQASTRSLLAKNKFKISKTSALLIQRTLRGYQASIKLSNSSPTIEDILDNLSDLFNQSPLNIEDICTNIESEPFDATVELLIKHAKHYDTTQLIHFLIAFCIGSNALGIDTDYFKNN